MNLLGKINEHWDWTGLKGDKIIGRNEFGNFLVLDEGSAYWRICPEELSCEIVAETSKDFFELVESEDFRLDWEMTNLVEMAQHQLGSLQAGWAFHLIIPALFGGPYEASNFGTAPLEELIELSGEWALTVKDVPEGGHVILRVTE